MLALIQQDKSGSITGWMFGDDTFELAARAQAIGAPDLAHRLREEPYPIAGKVEIMPGCTLLRDSPPKHIMGHGLMPVQRMSKHEMMEVFPRDIDTLPTGPGRETGPVREQG